MDNLKFSNDELFYIYCDFECKSDELQQDICNLAQEQEGDINIYDEDFKRLFASLEACIVIKEKVYNYLYAIDYELIKGL